MAKLKRNLGFWELALSGVGIIVGAGIFVLMGEAAGLSGNMVWASFLIASIIATLTGLSYAELSSIYPKAGAEFVYAENAFNKRIAFVVGWMLIIMLIIAASAVSLGFAGYFNAFFGTPIIPTALCALLVFSILLFLGVKESVRFAIGCSIFSILGLLFIIILSIPYLGSVDYFEFNPEFGFAGILTASALIFFAFIGFEEIVNLGEETKNPSKILPLALFFAIIGSSLLYVLTSISAVSIMPWQELAVSNAPLADVASHLFLGNNAFIFMGLIALFTTANTILLILLGASRITFGISREGALPNFLSKIHEKRGTPWTAIITLFILSAIFVFIGNISIVANMTNILVLSAFIVINCSVISLRYRKPNLKKGFKIPLNIGKFPILPFLGAISCLIIALQIELNVIIFGIGVILFGFIISYIFVKK